MKFGWRWYLVDENLVDDSSHEPQKKVASWNLLNHEICPQILDPQFFNYHKKPQQLSIESDGWIGGNIPGSIFLSSIFCTDKPTNYGEFPSPPKKTTLGASDGSKRSVKRIWKLSVRGSAPFDRGFRRSGYLLPKYGFTVSNWDLSIGDMACHGGQVVWQLGG